MEFDIGNILYIVITLVAVLVGVLGKKKKPAKSGSGSGEATTTGGFFENLEKAFKMGQEDQLVVDLEEGEAGIPPEETDYEPVDLDESPVQSRGLLDEYEQYLGRSGRPDHDIILSDSDIITEPLEVVDLDDDGGTDYFEVVKDFNAATAVVYAAIINRLDY